MKKSRLLLATQAAQSAIEYILLLTAVVAIVLIGFKTYLPKVTESSNLYYNRVAQGILGDGPRCGDGTCSKFETLQDCPLDC